MHSNGGLIPNKKSSHHKHLEYPRILNNSLFGALLLSDKNKAWKKKRKLRRIHLDSLSQSGVHHKIKKRKISNPAGAIKKQMKDPTRSKMKVLPNLGASKERTQTSNTNRLLKSTLILKTRNQILALAIAAAAIRGIKTIRMKLIKTILGAEAVETKVLTINLTFGVPKLLKKKTIRITAAGDRSKTTRVVSQGLAGAVAEAVEAAVKKEVRIVVSKVEEVAVIM